VSDRDAERYVRAFARGLDVLEAMGRGPARKTLAEVAGLCGLPRSVAKRLLLTLVAQGFAREDGRRYWLTPKALRLGLAYLYSLPFWRQAQLVLEELRAECGESCAMAVLDDEDIVYVVRVPSRRILSTNLTVGSRIPAHAVSLGRVLLAGLDDDALARYLKSAKPTAFTPRTIVAPAKLRAAIETVRENGYAWVDSELDDAICGIAVPVRDEEGRVVAAINVSLVAGSRTEAAARKKFLALLRGAAAKIRTATLGRQAP
jgi:IclR family pca regulon transcriptional regulator